MGIKSFLVYSIRRYTGSFRFILIYLIIVSYVPQGGMSTPWFEQKKRLEVVEPEDETKLEDDTNVPLWRAMFKKLRFSECLILIWVISGPLLGFCNEEGGGALSRVLKARALKGDVGVSSLRKFSNLKALKRYFQHLSRDMFPKNRPRIMKMASNCKSL